MSLPPHEPADQTFDRAFALGQRTAVIRMLRRAEDGTLDTFIAKMLPLIEQSNTARERAPRDNTNPTSEGDPT